MQPESSESLPDMLLIVDDSPDIRLLIRRYLEVAGYGPVCEAASAEEAAGLLGLTESPLEPAVQPASFDLALVDFMLPDENGLQLCRRISSSSRHEDMALLVVTSSPDPQVLSDAFEAGAWDFLQKPIERIALLARVRNALRLKQEIDVRKNRERDLLQLQALLEETNRRLRRQALQDELTGLPNRRAFEDQFSRDWRRAFRRAEPLALLMIDIDYFKHYNDRYLHLEGDRCLRQVSSAVAGSMFRSGDFVARFGGEEIAVILPHTELAGVTEVAERIRKRIEDLGIQHSESEAAPVVTVSVGGAWGYPSPKLDASLLLWRADQSLYRAKSAGRNCIVVEPEPLRAAE